LHCLIIAGEQKFETKEACRQYASEMIKQKCDEGYIETGKNPAHRSPLPEELIQGLNKKRKVKIPDGDFTILTLPEVKHIIVGVLHQAEHNMSPPSREYPKTPYDHMHGTFYTEAYSLVHTDDYLCDGILVWLPRLKMFGTWDSDHYELLVFPDVSWNDISADPAKYIAAQWDNSFSFPFVQGIVNVWEYFDFIPDDIYEQSKNIIKLTDKEGEEAIQVFLKTYEDIILNLPYSDDTTPSSALALIYNHLGKQAENAANYNEALNWFKKELCIKTYHSSTIGADVYLHLGFCYQKISSFENAMHYLAAYEKENPKSWFAWHTIALCHHKQNKIKEAVEAYRNAILHGTQDPYTYSNLAICLSQQNKIDAAIEFTIIAGLMNEKDSIMPYNLACYYSSKNMIKESLASMEESLQKGYANVNSLMEDADLANVRTDKKFHELLVKYNFK